MPTTQSIDLSARLEEMARLLVLQRAEPTLTAFDAVDMKSAARELKRLRDRVEGLEAENARLATEVSELERREDSRDWNESDWRD